MHEYACSVMVVADLDAVVSAIHKYLDRVTLHGPVTLDKLMQIEHKLMSDFQFAHFAMLDNGTFLEFILSQPDVKKVTLLTLTHQLIMYYGICYLSTAVLCKAAVFFTAVSASVSQSVHAKIERLGLYS